MSSTDIEAHNSNPPDPSLPIERLLVLADVALAQVTELPSPVRALIDSAAEFFVLTPSLPGRLAWLASQLNQSRHAADERLDTVLGHMRSIGAHANGASGDASTLTALADAVAQFKPDHILIALRSAAHASWQERGLIERIREHFTLPLTIFAVDPEGHVTTTPQSRKYSVLGVRIPCVKMAAQLIRLVRRSLGRALDVR